ncbi:adenylosuccinate synthetase [Leifsonia sp. NPDC056665]|uniref:adenylosuccinate synthetase n=1 Tax=Leifsonia sp. NPDC056665 TaxID=3345901 RepID=UPI0036886D7A
MPVSIIVGAQYGSEGKGKVALEWARRHRAAAAVRIGGPNSGHTVIWNDEPVIFKQLPTSILLPETLAILPPGAYINVRILLEELTRSAVDSSKVVIDPRAAVVTDADIAEEISSGLTNRIGSTASGTGAAVARRVRRDGSLTRASDVPELQEFLGDTLPLLHDISSSQRVVIEGTQGYGLSVLHGMEGDFATSRDTTAAGFLSETGLSPLVVDEIVLVARAYPIRVAGRSGSLSGETSWQVLGERIGRPELIERTTVTHRVRRVGEFDPEIVKRAIYANQPTHLVLNHVDYVTSFDSQESTSRVANFLERVEESIGRRVDFVGFDDRSLVGRDRVDDEVSAKVMPRSS